MAQPQCVKYVVTANVELLDSLTDLGLVERDKFLLLSKFFNEADQVCRSCPHLVCELHVASQQPVLRCADTFRADGEYCYCCRNKMDNSKPVKYKHLLVGIMSQLKTDITCG